MSRNACFTYFLRSSAELIQVEVNDKKHIIITLKRAVAEAKEREKQALHAVMREWEEKLHKQKSSLSGPFLPCGGIVETSVTYGEIRVRN